MRILVVEDNVNVSEAVKSGLVAEGFDVDIAHDGDTGLWLAREHDYSVLLLDIMLPKRSGLDVCAVLRKEGDQTPILMLTAKTADTDQANGLNTGADDYLTKPFSFVVLIARIQALLRRGVTPLQDDPVLVAGDISINPQTHSCQVEGTSVGLTRREFAVLEVLARSPGTVRSKFYLLDQVWGPDFEGTPNVVEVYVGYLRRKLASASSAANDRIQTVPGHGYRLVS
jgi:two-component system, OmpR family, response regulator